MNKRRLWKLARLLEQDAANKHGVKFDLASWAQRNGAREFPKKVKKLDCKTTACAVGLACLSGVFAKEGFSWKPSSSDNNIVPIFEGQEDFGAVTRFFDISMNEAVTLFVDSRYYNDGLPTQGAEGERAVAKRIREFVRNRG